MTVPSVSIGDGGLSLRLADGPPVRDVVVASVVDESGYGDVLGVEVLDLRGQTGGVLPPSPRCDLRWSYDAEIDAAYVTVRGGENAVVQRTVSATARVDAAGTIVALDVPLGRS